MQRLNRSAHAPKGSAFVLFLSLALVPFSLRAVGVNVTVSPSLSAATDAWQQIADLFGSGYQPARALDSAIPADQGREPLRAFDSSACPGREFACAREVAEPSAPAVDVTRITSPQAAASRRICPKAARASALPAAIERVVTVAANTEKLQTYVRALGKLRAMKLETVTHSLLWKNDTLLRDVERQILERQIVERGLSIPQNLKMFVRVKSPATPTATKAAETKVRAALDSARRIERERAALNNLSAANPDNCDEL